MKNTRNLWINVGLGFGAVLLILGNLKFAEAHNWWRWHWHTGSDIRVWVGGSRANLSNAALNEWDLHTDVRFPRSSTHTEMSVFDANYGRTGWGGLASIKSSSFDWWHTWTWSKINHCHSVVNNYYSPSASRFQGIQCQEIGHCMGLTHSNDGCMGLSYSNNLIYTVPHNWADANAKY